MKNQKKIYKYTPDIFVPVWEAFNEGFLRKREKQLGKRLWDASARNRKNFFHTGYTYYDEEAKVYSIKTGSFADGFSMRFTYCNKSKYYFVKLVGTHRPVCYKKARELQEIFGDMDNLLCWRLEPESLPKFQDYISKGFSKGCYGYIQKGIHEGSFKYLKHAVEVLGKRRFTAIYKYLKSCNASEVLDEFIKQLYYLRTSAQQLFKIHKDSLISRELLRYIREGSPVSYALDVCRMLEQIDLLDLPKRELKSVHSFKKEDQPIMAYHDYLSELQRVHLIKLREAEMIKENEDLQKLMLEYKEVYLQDVWEVGNYNVVITLDSVKYSEYAARFRNCINSYYKDQFKTLHKKIVFVMDKNNKPVYCAHVNKASIMQAKKPGNRSLTSEESAELKQLLLDLHNQIGTVKKLTSR